MLDSFRTISADGESLVKVKGSRFFGRAWPVDTTAVIDQRLLDISRRYHDATHHCFAYRLGLGNEEVRRYADAGEPSGTAGKPILRTICDHDLTDILVIVTRYFGGTKLGVAGLQRAYRQSAEETIAACPTSNRYLAKPVAVRFEYTFQNAVMRYLASEKIKIVESTYADDVRLLLRVRLGLIPRFKSEMTNLTRGSVHLEESAEIVKV